VHPRTTIEQDFIGHRRQRHPADSFFGAEDLMSGLRSVISNLYNSTYTNKFAARVRLLLQALEKDYRRQRDAGLEDLSNELKGQGVLSGPFQGLVHPQTIDTVASSHYPKLLGTYEKELHAPMERLIARTTYDAIVDVGSAEGYYTVGLAMRCPGVPVLAFDIDLDSRERLYGVAHANGVANQIAFDLNCTPTRLEELARKYPQGLLVSDCEGYELELLQPETISALGRWDLIIETHDSLELRVTRELEQRFRQSRTHRMQVIAHRRRRLSEFPGSARYPALVRHAAMDEGRTWRNRWMVCEAIRG
jgi:hypothetical protein